MAKIKPFLKKSVAAILMFTAVLMVAPVASVGETVSLPAIPATFYGAVTGPDGMPVESGYVEAYADGQYISSIPVNQGFYGGPTVLDTKLEVQATDESLLTFKVIQAAASGNISWPALQTEIFSAGASLELNLSPEPLTPEGFQAVLTGDRSVYLVWEDPGAAYEYKILRTVGQSTTEFTVTERSYQDSNIVPGESYTYQVFSRLADGTSSEPASTEISVPALPASPTGLSVSSNLAAITVNWDSVPGCSLYNVYKIVGGVKSLLGSTAQTVYNTTLDSGQNQIGVAAVGPGGFESETALSSTFNVRLYPLPLTPISFSAALTANRSVSLTWNDSGVSSNYRILRTDQNTQTPTEFIVDDKSFIDTNINPGVSYTYQVFSRAADEEESAPASTVVSVPALPASPTVSQPLVIGGNAVLSWQGDAALAGYVIYQGEVPGEPIAALSGTMSKDLGILGPGQYYYAISALSQYGFESVPAMFSPVVITATTNLQAGLEGNKAILTWDAKPGVSGYKIIRRVNGGQAEAPITVESNLYEDLNVTGGNSYYYSVDELAPLSWARVDLLFPNPSGLMVSSQSTEVSISWESLSGCSEYNVYLIQGNEASLLGTTTGTSYQLTKEYGDYFIGVTAIGFEQKESLLTQAVPVSVRPSAPLNLKVLYGSENNIQLIWDDSLDDNNSQDEVYNIYKDGILLASLNGWQYNTTISESTVFTLTYCTGGYESPFSAQTVADPTLSVPAAPINVMVFPLRDGNQLTWNPVAGARGYNVYRSNGHNDRYKQINEELVTETGYIDNNITGQQFYIVTAVFDTESLFSPPATTGKTGTIPAVLNKLAGDSQVGLINTLLPQYLVVSVRDQFGSLVPADAESVPIPVSFEITRGDALLYNPANPGVAGAVAAVNTDLNGEANVGVLLGASPQEIEIKAYIAGNDQVQAVYFTADSTDKGLPDKIEAASGNNQTGTANSFLPSPLAVKVLDSSGAAVPNIAVSFDIFGDTDGKLALNFSAANIADSIQTTTDQTGSALIWYKMGTGNGTVRATVIGYNELFCDFNIYTQQVQVSLPAKITKTLGDNQSGNPGWILPSCLEIRVLDANDLGVGNQTVVFSVLSGGGSLLGSIADNGSSTLSVTTDSQGFAYALLKLNTQGEIKVGATVGNIALAENFTAKSGMVQYPSLIEVSGGNNQKALELSRSRPIEVVVRDSSMAVVPNTPVTFSLASGGGTFEGALTATVTTDINGVARAVLTLPSLESGELSRNIKIKAEAAGQNKVLACYATVVDINSDLILETVPADGNVFFNPAVDSSSTMALRVKNSSNQAIEGLPVNWYFDSGSGVLQSTTVFTDANGEAVNYMVPFDGEVILMATVSGLEASTASFTVATQTDCKIMGTIQGYTVADPIKVWGVSSRGQYVEGNVSQATRTYELKIVSLADEFWTIGLDYNYNLLPDSTNPPNNLVFPAAREVKVDSGAQEITVNFAVAAKNWTVAGNVRNQNGQGVNNVVIMLENPLNPFAGTRGITGNDGTGSFQLKVRDGNYALSYFGDGYKVPEQHSLRVSSNGALIFDGVSVQQLNLVLWKPQSLISGTTTSQGQPLNQALIYGYDNGMVNFYNTSSNSAGVYNLSVEPGTVNIEGWEPVLGKLVLDTTNAAHNTNPLSVEAGNNLTGVNLIPMSNTGIITGIAQVDNRPISRAVITAVNIRENYFQNTLTDMEGKFSLKVPASANSYQVQLWTKETGQYVSGSFVVSVNKTIAVPFILARPASVTGFIRDSDGVAVPDAVITAVNENTQGYNVVAADSSGNYKLRLVPGSYRFEISSGSLGKIVPQTIEIANDLTKNFTIPKKTHRLTGQVRNGNNEPQKDVWVNATNAATGLARGVLTLEDGSYELNLPSGSYYLTGERADLIQELSQRTDALVVIQESAQTVTKNLKMTQAMINVSGYVYDEFDKGLAYANIWANDGRGGRISAVTDPDGYYSLKANIGTWYFWSSAEGYQIIGALKQDGTEDSAHSDLKIAIAAGNANISLDVNFKDTDRMAKAKPAMALIDPKDGGSLKMGDNSMELPPTALADYDKLSVSMRQTTNVPWGENFRPMSGMGVEINAVDRQNKIVSKLKDYVQLKLAFSKAELDALAEQYSLSDQAFSIDSLQVSYYNPDTMSWLMVPATLVENEDGSGYFIVATNHLTKFAIVYPAPLILRGFQDTTPVTPGGGGGGGGVAPGSLPSGEAQSVAANIVPSHPNTIVYRDGSAQVDIPADAFTGEVKMSIAPVVSNPAVSEAIGKSLQTFGGSLLSVYQLEAEDADSKGISKLNKNITLTIKVGNALGAVGLYYFDPVYNRLTPQISSYDPLKGVLTAELRHLSLYAAIKEKDPVFSDLKDAPWATGQINSLARKNILESVGDRLIKPNQAINRAEAVSMMILASGVPGVNQKSAFYDINESYWAKKYISAGTANSLLKGYSDGSFKPQNTLSRAELITMLMRFSGTPEIEGEASPWKDVAGSHWALGNFIAASRLGAISGYPDGSMRPERPVTRAEAAVLVAKIFWGHK